jgi:DNA-binding transcriptional LysR family regulator
MRPTLQQLETFYWVTRLGGFHAAARHLHLTQPTISMRIQELEEALHLKLFERIKQRAEITPAGRDVFAHAEKMLRLADELAGIAGRSGSLRGLLRLGANESTAITGLTELLSRLNATYPGLRIELTIDVGAALSRKLNARELDMAILSDPISAPHVIDEAIGLARLGWVASPRLALPKRELTPMIAASLPIVVTPAPSTLHSVVKEWFRSENVDFDNCSTCNSMALMTRLVVAGHAIALLPLSAVQTEINLGTVRALPAKPAIGPRTYYLSYLRDQRGVEDGAIVSMAREVLMQSGLLMPL